jgi:hypothetical protein
MMNLPSVHLLRHRRRSATIFGRAVEAYHVGWATLSVSIKEVQAVLETTLVDVRNRASL